MLYAIAVLHLEDDAIDALVDPASAEQAVWDAFEAWGHGHAATTQRVRAISPSGEGMSSAMAAVVPPYCGGKIYATAGGRFTFVNVLFSTDGALLATLGGDAITRLRTPAASSLAIRHLAPAKVTTAVVIGSGVQGWSHVEMLARSMPDLTELRLCGRPGSTSTAALVERSRQAGLSPVAFEDPDEAVRGAQVVVTLTSASTPLFSADSLGDDTLICAAGATKYDRRELGPDVVERCATVVCDDVAGAQVECGDLIGAAMDDRFDWDRAIELHAVAAGTATVGRAGSAPVLFETQGVAIQDVAVAALAYERHQATDGTSSPPR